MDPLTVDPVAIVAALLAGGLLVCSIWVGLSAFRARRRQRAWFRAAERTGLRHLRTDHGMTSREWKVLGRSGNLPVRFEQYPGSEAATRIVVGGLEHGARALSLRGEDVSTALKKRFTAAREIEIGDQDFDEACYVQGDAALALALLDATARGAVATLVANGVAPAKGGSVKVNASLDEGLLQAEVPDGAFRANLRRAADVLGRVLEVASRLVAPVDLAARIAENFRTEPQPGVRRRQIAVLVREFADHPATREALLAGREDPDPDVRVRAGTALGREGRDVVLAVARGDGATDAESARAAAALAGELSAEEAIDLLRSALRTRRLATAHECLRALGQRRDASVVATLEKVLAVEEGELAVAAADALGANGDSSAEAALLSALEDPAWELREAAARALGRVGTSAAVQPLKDLEQRDGSCRAAARQAVAEIQSRLTGAGPGQLTLAGGEAGALSLSDGATAPGRLSLAEDGAVGTPEEAPTTAPPKRGRISN